MEILGVIFFLLVHEDEVEGAALVEIGNCLIHRLTEDINVFDARMSDDATCDLGVAFVDFQ